MWIAAGVPLGALALLPPLAQDPAYHDFADRRALLGIPNFADLTTSLAFVAVALPGVVWLSRRATAVRFGARAELHAARLLFACVALTGLGSMWYHWAPNDARLVWDRLPMSVGFMAFTAMLVGERLSARLAGVLLGPLALLGAGSVWWWAHSGDLRLYAVVQFYPLLLAAVLLWLPSGYSHGRTYWLALACYALAKACELADAWLFDLLRVVSGHTLKHLLAALGVWWLLRMLRRRRRIGAPQAASTTLR